LTQYPGPNGNGIPQAGQKQTAVKPYCIALSPKPRDRGVEWQQGYSRGEQQL